VRMTRSTSTRSRSRESSAFEVLKDGASCDLMASTPLVRFQPHHAQTLLRVPPIASLSTISFSPLFSYSTTTASFVSGYKLGEPKGNIVFSAGFKSDRWVAGDRRSHRCRRHSTSGTLRVVQSRYRPDPPTPDDARRIDVMGRASRSGHDPGLHLPFCQSTRWAVHQLHRPADLYNFHNLHRSKLSIHGRRRVTTTLPSAATIGSCHRQRAVSSRPPTEPHQRSDSLPDRSRQHHFLEDSIDNPLGGTSDYRRPPRGLSALAMRNRNAR